MCEESYIIAAPKQKPNPYGSLQLSLHRRWVLLQVSQVPGKAIGDAGAVAHGIGGQAG